MAKSLFFVVLLLLCTVAFVIATDLRPYSLEQKQKMFETFVSKYKPTGYANEQERQQRFQVFAENIDLAQKMQADALAQGFDTQYGVTKFSDLTAEEFKKRYLSGMNLHQQLAEKMSRLKEYKVRDLPDHFDWSKQKGVVTYVKDQGQCGSCWAFSTTGNIEGQWALWGPNKTLVSLSEQQLVDCDHECDPEHPKDCDAGCNGGLMGTAMSFIIKNGGIATESSYPYRAYDGKCKPKDKVQIGATITEWSLLPTNETQLSQWLVDHGPIAVALDATPLQHYQSGIINGGCSKTELNHGVLLVGLSHDKCTFGHCYIDTWKVKNSWSGTWGESGYFRINRGGGTCGINTYALTAKV